jgi:hypothetical protein
MLFAIQKILSYGSLTYHIVSIKVALWYVSRDRAKHQMTVKTGH